MNARNSFVWKLLSTLVVLAMLIPANLFGPFVPAARADTATVNPTDDSYVDQQNSTTPYGSSSDLNVRSYRASSNPRDRNRRTFVRFTLPSLPSGAVLVSAYLQLNMTANPNNNRTYDVYRVTGGTWAEGTITWNNAPGVAGSSTDSTSINSTGWKEWDVTSDVQAFYGGANNYGWMIRDSSEGSSSDRLGVFSSKEGSYDPQLIINYNRSSPNTPTTISPNGTTETTRNPTFTWSPFSDLDTTAPGNQQNQSQVQVRTSTGTYGDANSEDSGAVSNATSTYTPSSFNLPDGNYCWRVRVHDNANVSNSWSNYSSPDTCFTVSANVPPNTPTLVDPLDGEIVVTGQPTLDWNATTDPDPGDSVANYAIVIDANPEVNVGLNTSYTPGTALSSGTHSWYVRACDTHSACSTSATWNFTVNTNIIGPNQDSYTDQASANANANFGTADHMYVRSYWMFSNQNRRMFLRFNLPAITTCYAGTTPSIVGATLRVYADSAPSTMRTYEVQRVTEAWTEGGITWNNQPNTTGSATDSTNVNSTGWTAWNVTADVQAFSDYGGAETNYGWMVLDSNESATLASYQTNFRSKEYTGSTYDPQLLIAYNCPPSAPVLVSPANNAYVAVNTPLLDWNAATDPDGDTLRYSVSVDGGAWTSPSPDTLTEITWGTLGEGQHNWQVRAFDGREYRYSENWSFTVDTDIPAAPGYLNEGNPDQDYYPSTAYSLLINWGSIGDTGSGIYYEVYRSTDGGVTFPTLVYNNTGTSFTDSGTLSDNTYIFYRVRTRTGAGTYSPGWTTSDGVRIDSQDPATVTGVGEGVTVGTDDDWSRDNVYWVYWNIVADTGSGITYEVQRSVNGGAYATFTPSGQTCDTSRCWGDDPVGHSNGNFVRYQVRAVNGAGRTSLAWSTPSDGITIDLALPDSSVTTGGVYKPATWTGSINGTASDPGGSGVTLVDIRIRDTNAGTYWNGTAWVAGETWVAALYTTGSWSYSFPAANLTDGHTYVVDSRATDRAGNVQTAFGNNNFTYSSTAPDAPAPTSTSHPNPALWYNDSQPSFVWNVPTSTISVQGYSIVLDQFPGTIPDTIQDTTGTSYDAATTADGVWYFHVRAQNIALTWGPAGHVRVNIDTATPQTPGSVTEENPDVDWDADGSITVYWSAVPNTGSGITYELQRSVNGGAYTFVVSTTATSYAHNPGGYSDGNTVRYRVHAVNGVGLIGGWGESDGMTIDSQSPASPAWVYEDAVAEPDRDYHNQANGAVTVRWAGVTDTGSGIKYRLERQVSTNPGVWTLVAENLAGTSYADSGSYGDGVHITYRVTAINGVGLASAPTSSDGFTIDLGIPLQPDWVREENPDIDYDYDGSFTVYWNPVADTGSGITYKLDKSVDGGDWTLVAEGISNAFRADTNTPNDGAFIRYRVTAVNGAGTAGAYRLSDGVTIDHETPAAPAWVYENNPDVDYDTDGAVLVNWAASANTGSGITYDVQKRVVGVLDWYDLVTNVSGTSFNDTDTYGDETLIEYRVLARNGVGRISGWTASDGVRVDVDTPAQVTGVGEGLVAGTDLDYVNVNSFIVFWNAVSPTATGDSIRYTVERNVNGSGWGAAATNVLATTWDDPQSFSNGDQVFYRVTASNGAGTSGPTSAASDGITMDTGQPNSIIVTTGYYNLVSWPNRIDGTSSDDYSGVRYVHITIYDTNSGLYWNGTTWAGSSTWLTATSTTNWTYALAAANLTNGHTYNLESRATDNAGNVETSYGVNSFTFASAGPQAPVITSSTHPNQATWYNQNAPAFSWTTVSSVTVSGYSYVLDQNPGTTPAPSVNTTGNSYSYASVIDGTWYFHVRALDQAGNWGPAGHYRINIDTATPQAPAGVTEESPDIDWSLNGNVTVYWTAVANTGSGIAYTLQRCVNGGLTGPCASSWVTATTGLTSTTNYYDNPGGYIDGDTVRYRVRAANGVALSGAWTESDGMTIDSNAPATPAWVTENAPDPNDQDYDPDGSVRVYWAAVSDTGSGLTYKVERRITVGGIPGSWIEIASGLGSTSYLDPRANQDGETIHYRVTAVNGVGNWNAARMSDGITIDTDTPAAPAEVTENSPDIDWSLNGSVSVFWGAVADTGTPLTYRLEKQVNSSAWTLVADNIPGGTTSLADSGAYNDGDVIRYQVRATNSAGTSGAWRQSDGMTIDSSSVAAPGWVREENPDIDYDADGALTVYWAAVSDTGSGITYRLEKQIGAGSWNVVAQGLAGTSYYDGQTQPDTTVVHYRVTAVNGVGTAGSPTTSDGVTIDTQTPGVPTGLGEGDVVGADQVFDRDNIFYVFWNSVADTGSGITYDIQKSLNGSAWTAATTGVTTANWEDPVPYSNGDTVQYRVRAVNGAGLEGAWSGASSGITLDFAQPDSSVATTGYYNAFNWPGYIQGAASDSLSDVAFVDVQIQRRSDSNYWNGAAWQAGVAWRPATGTYNWQYALAAADLTNGVTYDVRSRATDNAGNVETTFGANSFTYASTGPDVPTISSPTHPNPANWYNNSNPTFNWITPTSSVRVIGYSYLLDQNSTTTPDTQADTAGTTASYTGQADGAWWFHVRAGDDAGNWGPAGHFRINIDTHTPTAPATITEESPDVDWDSDGSVAVYWSAVANTGSGITYRLEYSRTGAPSWTLVPGADALAATNFTVGGFANGNVAWFRVRATNGVGLNSGFTQSDGVSFDLTTPQVPTGVGEGDVLGADDDWDQDNIFWVFWTAVSTTPSGITYSIERNRNNSGVWDAMISGLTTTQWDDPTAYLNGESVSYRVTAHTGAGRNSAASAPSDGLTFDFVQPSSAINTNGFYNNFTWPGSIQGTGTDDRSGVRFVHITIRRQSDSLYWTGATWGASTWLTTTGTANWTYTFTPGDGQTYNVQSRSTDYADNVQSALGTSTFNYSSSGPGAPVISSPTHPNPALWYTNNSPTLNWTTPSSGSGIQGYSYVLDHTADTDPDLAADTTGNTRSYSNIADGLWYFHVRAVDNANNWGPSAHYAVRVDTIAPVAPAQVTEESPDETWDADGRITVYWNSVTDASPVTYVLERSTNNGVTWVSVATGIATTSYLDPVVHPQGTHLVYHVRAVDSVSLQSGWTQSNGVTVDSQAPAQPTGVGEGDVVGADDAWDQDNTFYAFWNAVPNTGSGIFYAIERSVNGGLWQTVQTNYAQTYWEDPQLFVDTNFIQYRITAVSGMGLTGTTSAASNGITMDFTVPDSAVGTSGTYGPGSWTGFIAGTATDATSGVAQVQVTVQRTSDNQYWTGAAWQGSPAWLAATGTTAWSRAFTPASGETYNVQSRATDAAGNMEVSYGVSTFTYTSSEPDSTVATNGLYIGAAWPGNINGTAAAPMAAVRFVDITILRTSDSQYYNGTTWGAGLTWLRATGTTAWSYGFTPADGQTYIVRSRVTDMVGNVEVVYGSGTFSYDLAAPAIQTVGVTSDRAYFYNPGLGADGGSVYFNSRAGEGAGQILMVTVTYNEPNPSRMTGAPAFGDTPPADTAAPWTAQYSVEANAGTQSGVLFSVFDTLNLTDTASITFVEDNLAPSSSASIAADATNVSPIAVDWQANDSASGARLTRLWVKYQPMGVWTDTGLAMTGVSGSFDYTPTSGRGTYYFSTVAEDNVGNVEPLPTGLGDDRIYFDNLPSNTTAVAPMYAITSPIVVTWTADAETQYTYLYYRFGDTGPFTMTNLPFSTERNGTFAFAPTQGDGHYYFTTVAIDDAGNVEPIPLPDGKTMTIYDTLPPSSTATSPDEWSGFDFTVEWTGDDTPLGSGIATCDIQVKVGNGEWTDWITHTMAVSATWSGTYVGQPDETYHFRSRATDNAGHVEAWPLDSNGDTTTILHFPGSFPGKYKVYLPFIARGLDMAPKLPDLVVTGIAVTPPNPAAGQDVDVAVTIKNQGTADTSACFWIDLYINPTQLPITVNKGWFEAGSEGGLVWWQCGLNIGQSTTLHFRNDTHYRADLSRFDGRFPSPRVYNLYAQVDSYNLETTYGVVYESNDQNNVYGLFPVTVGGSAGSTGALGTMATPRARPNIPPGGTDH